MFNVVVYCPEGVTWDDFDSLKITVWGYGSYPDEAHAQTVVDWKNDGSGSPDGGSIFGPYNIAFSTSTILVPGQTQYKYRMEMTYGSHATGIYTLTMQIL
jgi:hypothetical protein